MANFVPQREKFYKEKNRTLKTEPWDLVSNKRKGALEFQSTPWFHRSAGQPSAPWRAVCEEGAWAEPGSPRLDAPSWWSGSSCFRFWVLVKKGAVLLGAREIDDMGQTFKSNLYPGAQATCGDRKGAQRGSCSRENIFRSTTAVCVGLPFLILLKPPQVGKLWWLSVPVNAEPGNY